VVAAYAFACTVKDRSEQRTHPPIQGDSNDKAGACMYSNPDQSCSAKRPAVENTTLLCAFLEVPALGQYNTVAFAFKGNLLSCF
jgi:hypothetical protein